MNFLQITQALRRESRSTAAGSSGPTTVVSQTGVFKDLVDWCAEAYNNIQRSSPDWRWLRSRFTLQTVASDDTYAYGDATDVATSSAITRFSRWIIFDAYGDSNVTCYLTASGVAAEQYLTYLDWASFRALYKFGAQTDGVPVHFTVTPANELMVGPAPSAVYTIKGEYQKSNQTLAVDADEPEMPDDYHMLVVWDALQSYASSAVAPELWTKAEKNAAPLRSALHRNQAPQLSFGGALY